MKRKNILFIILYIIVFIAVLAISVYLIYIIPESLSTLQTILTTIVAAVYGGLLTLAGVAWTIRKADADKKETNRRLATPFFGIEKVHRRFIDPISNPKEFSRDGKYGGKIFSCDLVNSDKCVFYIDKLQVENEDYFPEVKILIRKEESFTICVVNSGPCKSIRMFITDINYEQRVFDIIYSDKGEYNQIVEVNQ